MPRRRPNSAGQWGRWRGGGHGARIWCTRGRPRGGGGPRGGWGPWAAPGGRVARAKDLLHARLTRRGLAPSAWLLPLAVSGAFPAVTGKASAAATALAAALLANDGRRRWLVGAAVLLLSCVGVAASVVVYR